MSATPGPPPQLAALGEAYDWGAVHSVSYLFAGVMNRNWRIRTDTGVFALKQLLDVTPDLARRNLRVLAALIADGVPGCQPQLGVDGDPVVEIDGTSFCLLAWLEGRHPHGPQLSLTQAKELGAAVGRIHHSLQRLGSSAGLPDLPDAITARVTDPHEALREANRYLAAAHVAGGTFDATVGELLTRRKILLDTYATERPASDIPTGRFGWTHGDLQYRNILWDHTPRAGTSGTEEHIVGVLDWDRIRIRPYAEEVVRTATVQFSGDDGRLDLPRITAFTSAYRAVVPLSDDELADGVLRLWYKRLSDFWHLVFHYDRNDHSCNDLFSSSERTLEWWTAHRDEVLAAFTTSPREVSTDRGDHRSRWP